MALKRLFFSAAALSAARVFQLGVSFLTVPFMARLLDPHDFGLVALGMAMVSLTLSFSDAGLSRSLVRASELDSDAWSSAHWLIVGAMGAVSLILFALSWPAAIFFHIPALTPVIMALSLMPLMQGFLELPIASLIKRENLLPLAAADFSSALVGAAAAIGFGLAGFGAWALVAQNIANIAVRSPIILIAARFKPQLSFKLSALEEHLRFARDTLAYSLTSAISRQIDPLAIGKILGTIPLGLYSVAFRIMGLPSSVVGTPMQTTLFPRLVKLRDNKPELKSLVLATTIAQAALVFPPMAALAAASGAFFTLLLSARWAPSALLFSALAIAGLVQTVVTFNGPLLQATGRTGARLRLTIEFALLWALSVPVIAQFGVEAVAIGFSVVNLIYLPRLLSISLKPIDCSLAEYAKALMGPTLIAAAIVACHLGITRVVHLSAWEELGLAAAETAAGYIAFVVYSRRDLLERLRLVRSIVSTG